MILNMNERLSLIILLSFTVAVSGCMDSFEKEKQGLQKVDLTNSQIKNILGSDQVSRNKIGNISNGINESKVLNWKKVSFESKSSDQELNYSIYEFETEAVARNQIDNYSDTILRRGTYPTVGTEFNGFTVKDDEESYKIFEDYQRKGRFVYGVSIRSSGYREGQASYLNENLTSQIREFSGDRRMYANPETVTLSLNNMPTREGSIGTDYTFAGRIHETQGLERRAYGMTNLSSENILEIAESTYTLGIDGDPSENPSIVLSSVKLYETEQKAKEAQSEFVSSLRENSTSFEKIRQLGNATKLRFVPDTGFKNVIILGSTRNLNYYVVTAGSEDFFPETTEKLFLEMYSSIPRSQRTSSNLVPMS